MNDTNRHGYQLHTTTPVYLELVRKHTEPYTFQLNGEDILVLPGVMSPKYDWAGHFMIEKLPAVEGKEFLEIGSGCGLVSMAAFRRGANTVLATDISPQAVENTRLNFKRIGAEQRCRAIQTDMFQGIDTQFDVVVFNAPYHGCRAADDLEKGVADNDYTALRSFFSGVSSRLRRGAIAAVGFSSSGDHELFTQLKSSCGLIPVAQYEDIRDGYQCEVHLLRKD